MNKKNIVIKSNIEKVANWLKLAADDYKLNDSSGCYNFPLNSDFVLAVGWSDGFNMADTDIIKSKEGQKKYGSWVCGWAVNAAVKVRNDFDCSDFDFLDFPYYEDSGECYDTSIAIRPNETRRGYKNLAKWFLINFVTIVNLYEKGKLKK